ncbi:hypothetical protein BH10BDE1_BH10BDE1_21480 [soil metagenome]
MRFASKFASILTSVLVFASARAFAQSSIDPSSALLLNSNNSSTNRPRASETRLDSGRYTVRPRADRTSDKTSDKASDKPANTKKPVETSTAAKPVEASPSTVSAPSVETATMTESHEDPRALEATSEGAVMVALPEATRLLDISIATAYLYEDSQSGYSFRQETMASPAYVATGRAWLSPEFAVGGTYLSTFGGQVADRAAAVTASRTETAFGIYLRKLFAQSHVTFGVELIDSQFRVSSDTVSKLKTKSGGVRLSLEGEFQTSLSSAWLIGFSASPRLQHEEITAATEARSGTGVNAYAVGASLERRWRFDSSNALFIRLEHKFERDLFTGPATLADPIGGATPDGVAASVGTTLIQFGYNWGG